MPSEQKGKPYIRKEEIIRGEDLKMKTKSLMFAGILGSVLTILADFLLLGADASEAGTGMFDKYLEIASKVSYMRIGLAGFIGFIGIPITAVGFLALCRMLKDKKSRLAKMYKYSILICFGILGGGVHLICCYLLAGMKMNLEADIQNAVSALIKQQAAFVVPSCIVFFVFYFIACICMMALIAKGKTILPKWMWILNPLVLKICINALGKLGTSAFFNGLACSNMSLGALIILFSWLIEVKKYDRKKELQK
jgi:hypothetical protein